jgi:hypothetical protein
LLVTSTQVPSKQAFNPQLAGSVMPPDSALCSMLPISPAGNIAKLPST